jgi:FkbM family methyltransferase
MIARLARLANDSYCLWRTPHSTEKKMSLWLNLLHPSRKMLGFDVEYCDAASLEHLYREIFARQHYYFNANIENPVVFDCGANIGIATLYYKWLYPKARVYAFEPAPAAFAVLERNIVRNRLADVLAHNCALWDETGEIDFFVDNADPGSLLMSADVARLKGRAIHVPSKKLSEFIQDRVDLVKLDVEGAEHRILSDLVSSRKIQYIQQMVIEYHHHVGNQRSRLSEFLGRLETAGFEYQIHSSLWPVTAKNVFQDMLIGAYRPAPAST